MAVDLDAGPVHLVHLNRAPTVHFDRLIVQFSVWGEEWTPGYEEIYADGGGDA